MPTALEGSRVLVTGGAGFVGSNLLPRLVAMGCRVRATLHARGPVVESDGVEYVQADLTNMRACRRVVEDVDYVFMCAAVTSGAAVMTATPLAHVTPNVVMNAQILEAAYEAKVKKFVFISSSAAYPPTGDRPVREGEMLDGDPPPVYYIVGWMKRYAEILCRIYAQEVRERMPTLVVRPSNLYGPNDDFDFRTSHAVPALVRRVVERHDPIEVWGTGDDVRDLLYVDDFIDGLLIAFEASEEYLAINIGSGKGYSVKEVLRTALEVDGYMGAGVTFDASKPTTIPVRLVDTRLAERLLRFHARTTLAEGLRKTIAWYRQSLAQP